MTDKTNGAPVIWDKQEIANLFEQVGAPADKVENFVEIFESAVAAQVNALTEAKTLELEAVSDEHIKFLNEKAEDYVELIREDYQGKIASYADHFAREFAETHKPQLESNIKANLFESLMNDVLSLVENYNIKLTDQEVDVVESLNVDLQDLKEDLSKSQNSVIALTDELNEMRKTAVIATATSDLTESQAERVKELAEEISYSPEFGDKVQRIIMAISATNPSQRPANLHEHIEAPDQKQPVQGIDQRMASYLTAAKNSGSLMN